MLGLSRGLVQSLRGGREVILPHGCCPRSPGRTFTSGVRQPPGSAVSHVHRVQHGPRCKKKSPRPHSSSGAGVRCQTQPSFFLDTRAVKTPSRMDCLDFSAGFFFFSFFGSKVEELGYEPASIRDASTASLLSYCTSLPLLPHSTAVSSYRLFVQFDSPHFSLWYYSQ